jgi:hypothetical protein
MGLFDHLGYQERDRVRDERATVSLPSVDVSAQIAELFQLHHNLADQHVGLAKEVDMLRERLAHLAK